MSRIAEKRTDEIVGEYHDGDYTDHSRHNTQWVAFKQGYDQAMQDLLKDANQYMYLSDEIGYAYACGCRRTMQDFMEKAERYLQNTLYDRVEIEVYGTVVPNIIGKKGFIENFKNYMKNEM